MSANDIMSYFFTTLSFLSVIYALFVDNTGTFACVLALFAIFSFLFLIRHIRFGQNKVHTLQILSKENRPYALRLLLTYEQLKYSTDIFSKNFSTPKIHADFAHYVYEIIPSSDPSKNSDLKCTFTFQIKKAPKNGAFDILISQPRGKALKAIKYKFSKDGQEHITNVKKIKLAQNKAGFSGFLKAQISLNDDQERIETLIVSYTLKEIYRTGNTSRAFLLCPFVYCKKIDQFDAEIIYPKDAKYQPKTVCLKLYPYNGKKYKPEQIVDFLSRDERSLWSIQPVHCITNAVYIIEMHS